MQEDQTLDSLRIGTASENEISAALKAAQNALSVTLIDRAKKLEVSLSVLDSLLNRAVQVLNSKLSPQLEAEAMQLGELTAFIDKVQTRQIQTLDLYRKIIQGNPLFVNDTVSEEERMVIKLLRSFKTPEQKEKFLSLCKEQLANE